MDASPNRGSSPRNEESVQNEGEDHDGETDGLTPEETEVLADLARHQGNDGYTFGDGGVLNNDHDHDHDHATGGHAQSLDIDLILAYASGASGYGANLPNDQNTHRSTARPQNHEHDHQDHGQNAAELDPAALLESLANFDPPSSNENNELSISNADFASLLRAAASATGDDVFSGRAGNSREHAFEDQDQGGEAEHAQSEDRSYDAIVPRSFLRNHSKRGLPRKGAVDAEQIAKEREYWGTGVERVHEDDQDQEYMGYRPGTEEARAAGVHSAVALFRRPTSASRKYTRPPMSKLFTSVELEPEKFLELQGAAKAYMLDPNYPERSDCVGNRGKGDADMIKLKLFGCVKGFLEDDGWGERCWGEGTDPYHHRKLHWPADKNRIIALITPLLRRMVTNERQRQYAVVTRKEAAIAAPPKRRNKRTHEKATSESSIERPPPPPPPAEPSPFPSNSPQQPRQPTPQVYPDYPTGAAGSYNNNDHTQSFEPPIESANMSHQMETEVRPHAEPPPKRKRGRPRKTQHYPQDQYSAQYHPPPHEALDFYPEDGLGEEPTMHYHLSIINPTRTGSQSRIRPLLLLTHHTCPGFPSLVQHIHNLLSSPPYPSPHNASNGNSNSTANVQEIAINNDTQTSEPPREANSEETPASKATQSTSPPPPQQHPTTAEAAATATEEEERLQLQRIRVLLPTKGLTDIDGEDSWLNALQEIDACEWMDGNVTVVVEAGVLQVDVDVDRLALAAASEIVPDSTSASDSASSSASAVTSAFSQEMADADVVEGGE